MHLTHVAPIGSIKGLEQKGYLCETSVIGKQPKDAVKLLPHVHLIVALLKRWLLGTHPGAVSRAYLGYYLMSLPFDSTGANPGTGASFLPSP